MQRQRRSFAKCKSAYSYANGSQSKSIERDAVSEGSDLERLESGENGASGPAPINRIGLYSAFKTI